ncbi:MAG: DNA adenine methylase [Saprospiraceae bacterium]|nr:DNA adenine methylase [Saprospiraceae bacterium]
MVETTQKIEIPAQFDKYPRMRFMGNKYKLIPWLNSIFQKIEFQSVIDPFSGSGTVSYLFKTLGKSVKSSDFLNFPNVISKGLVENNYSIVSQELIDRILNTKSIHNGFAFNTYKDIFFSHEDLKFIDTFWTIINSSEDDYEVSLAKTALIRSCAKKQPRGVFTVASSDKYDDGRRDLMLTLKEHFNEQCEVVNNAIFHSEEVCTSQKSDVFNHEDLESDLVYLDPPYIPKENDNCYMKRYHFLEGVSCNWRGQEIMETSKVRKIKKPYTAFSYKRTAVQTFDNLFQKFRNSKIALSYSSNSIPSLNILVDLLSKYKSNVEVFQVDYTYSFGNHENAKINEAKEFLILGQ